MTNGISQQTEKRSFWTEVLTPHEWAQVVRILAQTDASVRLFFAGTDADRPSRDRAAGFLVALSGPAGGVSDAAVCTQARALLENWVRRDPGRIKPQFPREAREPD